MQAPPQGPPGPQCPNCGYPYSGSPKLCPTCGFRLKRSGGSCRLIASILLLVLFTLIGGAFLLLAACAAGLSNGSAQAQSQATVNQWATGIGIVEFILASWMIYEIVRVIRKR